MTTCIWDKKILHDIVNLTGTGKIGHAIFKTTPPRNYDEIQSYMFMFGIMVIPVWFDNTLTLTFTKGHFSEN